MANMSNGRLILSASRSIRGLLRPGLLAAQKCPALTSNILAKTHQSQQQNFLVRKELHASASLGNVEGQLAPELKVRKITCSKNHVDRFKPRVLCFLGKNRKDDRC